MGTIPIHFADPVSGISELGYQVAQWVRREGTSKEVARLFKVSPKTVDVWREGQNPSFKHFAKMVDRWGAAFLMDVFQEAFAESEVSLIQRISNIEHQLASVRDELTSQPIDGGSQYENVQGICQPDGAASCKMGRVAPGFVKVVARTSIVVLCLVSSSLLIGSQGVIDHGTEDWRTIRLMRGSWRGGSRPAPGSRLRGRGDA